MQKRLEGKDVTILEARAATLAFQAKLGIYNSTLGRCDFQYFANLSSKEKSEESVFDNDLHIYINHIKNLQEDLKVRFKYLLTMDNGLFPHLILKCNVQI